MFGMSSEEFWEQSPQLYWSYRTFYIKKIESEREKMKYESWLNGKLNSLSVSIALSNSFSKTKTDFPSFDETFGKSKEKSKKLTPKEEKNRINLKVQEEWVSCARF